MPNDTEAARVWHIDGHYPDTDLVDVTDGTRDVIVRIPRACAEEVVRGRERALWRTKEGPYAE